MKLDYGRALNQDLKSHQNHSRGWGYGSVVEYLPSMQETLGSFPSTMQKRER
jgi:hypothetical protein